MTQQYLVRIGNLGHVGRFSSLDATVHRRKSRVVCRSARGLEIGEVLSATTAVPNDPDGELIRRVTVQDELLLARIAQRRQAAFSACSDLIARRQLPVTLMDVEHLFDGQSIYFYFLGKVTDEVEALTSELAAAYEAKVQFREFARSVTEGCGPGCGTDEAENGCSSGSCSSCALSSSCGTRR